jgi:hypothetical protein
LRGVPISSDFDWLFIQIGYSMGGNHVRELALLDQAGQALADAQNFEKIKEIRDKAEAVRKYAQSASLGLGIQNRAAEVKLRAERQAGKLLAEMTLRGGDRRSKNHNERLKLEDLGISRNQSTRWQMQARVPENVFREHIRLTCDAGKELTSARLLRFAKQWTDSSRANGHDYGNRGKRVSKLNGDPQQCSDDRVGGNPAVEIISELTNHHQLLDNVLRPIYTGDATTLAAADRRVLRYLLLEIRQLLGRLDKWQHRANQCCCRDERPRF